MLQLPKIIFALAFAAAILITGTPIAILVGGIVGGQLAPNATLATLPIAMMVIGVAVGIIPAARLLMRYGYQKLFLLAAISAISANLLCITALIYQWFYGWLLAMLLVGITGACAQQFRFIVSEYLNNEQKTLIPSALSVFMLGGVVAAILGPELALSHIPLTNVANQLPTFTSGYIILSLLQIITLIFVWRPLAQHSQKNTPTTAIKNTQNHNGTLAILASVTAYGVMSFIMTATPISMHDHHHHSLEATKSVIQWHILAMFLPSLITGKIVQWLGIKKSLALGLAIYTCVFLATLQGVQFIHYASGLILLGLGWNILFTTGSTLAAQQTDPKFKGHHDAWVFGIQAIASLSAGFIVNAFGWQAMQVLAAIALCPLIFILIIKK